MSFPSQPSNDQPAVVTAGPDGEPVAMLSNAHAEVAAASANVADVDKSSKGSFVNIEEVAAVVAEPEQSAEGANAAARAGSKESFE